MREKLQAIYGNKAAYYSDVLATFDEKGVKYVLLSILVADDNPGDLDVLLVDKSYKEAKRILKGLDFSYYTKYETDQYLWNKYVAGIGFIQIHCYLSFSFQRRNYLRGYTYNGNETFMPSFQFYVFLIESFYKQKRRDKQYEAYIQLSGKEGVIRFSQKCPVHGQEICKQMIDNYERKKSILKKTSIIDISNRILRRLCRLFCGNDKKVLFIGVDGAGKSSIVEGVRRIYAKGGMFPKIVYLGLKDSIFNNKVEGEPKKTEGTKKELQKQRKQGTLVFIRNLKALLYWAEYNIKYILRTCTPNSVPTVYLIDRCYIDLLRYYPTAFARWLFIEFSLYPRKMVLLTGDQRVLYERKREFSEWEFAEIYDFYKDIERPFENKRGDNLLKVDTTEMTLEESVRRVSDFIMSGK